MSPPAQWEFGGNIPENYARYMEPAIFAPWAVDLVDLAALQPVTACWTWPVGRGSWRGVPRSAWGRLVRW